MPVPSLLGDGLALTDGLTLGLGVGLGLELSEGETDADGLLMASLMAKCAIARSSLVPEVIPTERLPWPEVVSLTPTSPVAPTSMLFRAVLLAPLVGSV